MKAFHARACRFKITANVFATAIAVLGAASTDAGESRERLLGRKVEDFVPR